jgi:nicotinamide-nucleotide amidase
VSRATATDVVAALIGRGLTVAVAESLTGGLVVADLVSVAGASAVVRGGVVAYATELKHELLGVDAALLAAGGPIQAAVAEQMAAGVRVRLGADLGLATTGVAGPDPQDGHPPGEVWIAVATADGVRSVRLELGGDRDAVRRETVVAVLGLALESSRES